MSPPARPLGNGWSSSHFGDLLESADTYLAQHGSPLIRHIAPRCSLLRVLVVWRESLRRGTLVVVFGSRDSKALLGLAGLAGSPPIVVLELISPRLSRPAFDPSPYGRAKRALLKQSLRRALHAAHVLTETERYVYSGATGIPAERFAHIPRPLRRADRRLEKVRPRDANHVVASGREADWRTLLTAADPEWQLTIVCLRHDIAYVEPLARRIGAQVLHDLSERSHLDVLRTAAVYVIPLEETGASIGQMRLMNANEARVPVVVSDVLGIREYIRAGGTAVVVPPGEPNALSRAVSDLLRDPERAATLVDAAWRFSEGKTLAAYLGHLERFVSSAIASALMEPRVSRWWHLARRDRRHSRT